MTHQSPSRLVTVAVLSSMVALSGCFGADRSPISGTDGPLTEVCPDPVVVQADWYPEAEQGAIYQLLDPSRYDVDGRAGSVLGRLVSRGQDMGVNLEIRVGGQLIDFRQVSAELHRDHSILLGAVTTDEAILSHAHHPTVAVVAPLEVNPQMIMWDPDTYDVDTIADLPSTTSVSLHGPGPMADHLVVSGIVDESQLDFEYTGTPDRWLATAGSIAQQGFATASPYVYLNRVEDWGRPVRYELLHDTGWEVYAGALAARPGALEDHADCLAALVPLVQQAVVDFTADPGPALGVIVSAADQFDRWRYERALAEWSAEQQRALGIVGNGTDETVGNFELDRVQRMIDEVAAFPGVEPGLQADELVTNRFIDPSIGIPVSE